MSLRRILAAAMVVAAGMKGAWVEAQDATPPPAAAAAPADSEALTAALERAGENRAEIEAALQSAPAEQQTGMRFLVRYMPARDLQTLRAGFLLENVAYAYRTRNEAPWGQSIPEDVFLNDVLPYANINERRDRWRKDFYERFQPLVQGIEAPGKAAAVLNRKIFSALNVRYSTQRRRADQAPLESIETGLASCTGLSVLLIDACRAVGVPARFVGTPLWTDKSGNHSWVEVWDRDWHFTGAAEPAGDELDQAWFTGRASQADPEHQLHAIYAASYKPTPILFPLAWDRSIDYVFAVNVTPRYLKKSESLADGQMRMMFRILGATGSDRCQADLVLRDKLGKVVFQGRSKDERFDANDHVTAVVNAGDAYQLEIRHGEGTIVKPVHADQEGQLITVDLPPSPDPQNGSDPKTVPAPDASGSAAAIAELESYLAQPHPEREALERQPFALTPLSRKDVLRARSMLEQDHRAWIGQTRAAELEARVLKIGEQEMKFDYQVFGEKPESGRSLFISMHGGGGAPKEVNDRQWENQKRLYKPKEGVYLSPRAPTDSWNMWHQAYMEPFLGRLIEDLIVLEDVDPDRVYLMGYSAGGDGVYQLAPRMADWLGAAAMMAGHPNESQPQGLRNLAFTMHVGGDDSAYQRNQVAQRWADRLAELRKEDPEGYEHWAKIYPGKGHWLDREDAAAVPWMAQHRRNLLPSKIVWRQDDVVHTRFYWLEVSPENALGGKEIVVRREGQTITIDRSDTPQLTILLRDAMLDLDQIVRVEHQGEEMFQGRLQRTIANLARTLRERGDPRAVFEARVTVELKPAAAAGAP